MSKLTVRMMIATAFVVLFWGASAMPAQTVCSRTTDAEIVQAIKMQFEADAEIKDQMRHLNVSVKKRIVTLEGWLDSTALINKAKALVRKTKCVKRVVSRLKQNGGGSCGPGMKPCGDTCISEKSTCTIGVDIPTQQ